METAIDRTAKTFRIPERNMERLQNDFAKLVKRAVRLDVAPPVLTIDQTPVVETLEVVADDGRTETRVYRFFQATVSGETPRLPGGWILAATLSRLGDANLIVGTREIPERYRTADPDCDHCQVRRFRKEIFVLVNDAGEWKQVGRQCLADFLGHADPEGLVAGAELLAEAFERCASCEDEPTGGGGSGEYAFSLTEYMSYVCMVIRTQGYMSRREASDMCKDGHDTATQAWLYMRPGVGVSKADRMDPSEEDTARAIAAVEWATTIDTSTDFAHNMHQLAKVGVIAPIHFGIAAYIPVAYAKARADAIRDAAAPAVSEYFGEIGKRAVYTLTVFDTRSSNGGYGVTTLITFRDDGGRVAKWWTSGEAPDMFSIGTTLTVKATVKRHGEWLGVKETTLSRVSPFVPKAKKRAAA